MGKCQSIEKKPKLTVEYQADSQKTSSGKNKL